MVENNHQRMRALIEKHQYAIRGYLRKLVGPRLLSKTTIDDLLQETCIRLLRGAHGYDHKSRGQFLRFAYLTAYRIIWTSSVRLSKRLNDPIRAGASLEHGFHGNLTPPRTSTPSSHAARSELTRNFKRAMWMLPPRYRQAIQLYRLDGLPLEAVASHLGIKKPAVCSLLNRAQAMLKDGIPDPWPT